MSLASWWRGQRDRWAGRQFERKVKRGNAVWGRQPEPPGVARTKVRAEISAVVTRAAGRVEDLGVIYKDKG
jgi:hypothetical protein